MAGAEKTYYEVLAVTSAASKPDIDRAYLALKTSGQLDGASLWAIERAYLTLSNPNLKRRYDDSLEAQTSPAATSARPASGPAQNQNSLPGPSQRKLKMPVLIGLFALLILVLSYSLWPLVGWRVSTYSIGTELITKSERVAYGKVLEVQNGHHFPGGITLDAYRIRLPSGAETWVSRQEANQIATPVP